MRKTLRDFVVVVLAVDLFLGLVSGFLFWFGVCEALGFFSFLFLVFGFGFCFCHWAACTVNNLSADVEKKYNKALRVKIAQMPHKRFGLVMTRRHKPIVYFFPASSNIFSLPHIFFIWMWFTPPWKIYAKKKNVCNWLK